MKDLYILILTGFLNSHNQDIYNIPYLEILSTHTSYKSCDESIISTHDYYLAKDIRRKNTKQRKPRFLYDNEKNKILFFRNKGTNYYASCKKLHIK